MKAEEAKRLTEQNQLNLDKALKFIDEAAKRGESMCIFSNLHADTFNRLFDLGYTVSKVTDPMGYRFIRIEW